MASKKLKIKDTKQYDKYKKSVENFAPLVDYIDQSNLRRDTRITINTHLTLYCCSQDKDLSSLLKEAKREEKSIEELSDRKIGKRLVGFEQYLTDAGYAERTVRDRVKTVRSFYRRENVTVPPKDLRPLINPELRKQIENSEIFKDFIAERNLTNASTIGGYLTSLTGYCDYYGMSIEDLIEEAEREEDNQVRLGKRKVKKRLIEYRNHLYKKQFSNKTVRRKMTDITYFYVMNDIEIPPLPKASTPYDRGISFDEVPKKEHVKKAIETTTSIKNRALFFFCMTSLSGSAEAREFSVEEYIRGAKGIPDHINIDDIDIGNALDEIEKDLNEALEKPQDQNESIIPVFHIVRKKKKRDYFTCITPEANQYIINYLKTREGLTLEDKVFDYSRKSLINAFQTVNDKNNWGWINRGRQRFFTSHQLRRLGANLIENERLVNEISGRKFDETTEAYFKRDKDKIRKEYFKFLDELTIYQRYRVSFMTDEKYARFSEELQAEKDKNEKLMKKIEELENSVDKIGSRLNHLNNNEPIDVEIKSSLELFIRNLANPVLKHMIDDELREKVDKMSDEEYDEYLREECSTAQYVLMHCDKNILFMVNEVAYDIAVKEGYDGSYGSALDIVEKALYTLRDDKGLFDELDDYQENHKKFMSKLLAIEDLVEQHMKKIGIDDEEEQQNIIEEINQYLFDNKELVSKRIPDSEFAYELIFKFQ